MATDAHRFTRAVVQRTIAGQKESLLRVENTKQTVTTQVV